MKNIIKKSAFLIFVFGLVFSFASQVSASTLPVAITYPASNVTSSTATLNGYFNSNGLPTTTFFQYARIAYGGDFDTTARVLQSTNSGTFSASLTDLIPNTKYYVRAVSQNSSGKVVSTVITQFRTLPSGSINPSGVTVTTGSASLVTSSSANLSGSFSGAGSSSQTYFEYGTSSGSLTLGTSSVSQTASSGTWTDSISGLAQNTTYYVRAVIITNGTTVRASNIISFDTTSVIPNPTTCSISSFSSSDYRVDEGDNVTLSWATTNCTYASISPIVGSLSNFVSGSKNVSIDEQTTFTLTAGNQFGIVTESLTVRLYSNGNGNNGNSNAYSTGASNITTTSATLSGYANGNGQTLNSWIEFPCWSGNKYDYRTSSGQVNLSYSPNNLLSGTTYCYRVGYQTSSGYVYDGASTTFTTLGTATWNSWMNNNTYNDVYQNPSVIYKTITTKTDSTNVTRNVFDSYPFGFENPSFNGSGSNNDSLLGAQAFSAVGSFLPNTFIGWLLFVIFVLAIVLISRALMASKNNAIHH